MLSINICIIVRVVFNGNPRYMYVCMYSFFYGMFTRTSMNNLDSMQRTALFMRVEYPQTNTVDLHTHTVEDKETN